MNELQLIQLFRDAAEAHTGVNYFDSGAQDFTFSNMKDVEFPLVFVQSLGADPGDNRITYNFTIYALAQPLPAPEYDSVEFQFDSTIIEARDTALQILKDITGRARLENQQHFIVTLSNWVQDGNRFESDGYVGWRVDFGVDMDFLVDNSNFPKTS